MKTYFDFEQKNAWTDKRDPDFIKAWNEQCYVNTNRYMFEKDFKAIDEIKLLMHEQKLTYINELGKDAGMAKYKATFLNGSGLSEDDAARGLYNAVNYAIAYGAQGKNVKSEFFNDNLGVIEAGKQHPTDVAVQSVKDSISKVLPELDTEFVNSLVNGRRNNEIKRRELLTYAEHTGKILGREAQIEFVKNSIDSNYTFGQRFKAVLSSFNNDKFNSSLPYQSLGEAVAVTAVKAVAYVALAPVVATAIGVKVFGGEAAEMKVHDAMDKVGEKYQEIKGGLVSVKNNVAKALGMFRKDPESENKNDFKPK